jgi:CheY-like chemotaxis protein
MKPLKILLVDDSKSARYALRLQLQQHKVMVETADSAESALERVRESPPDAIFMDHRMPGMSGLEAMDILKTTPATAHIPVVICTPHKDPESLAKAREKGAFDIFSKVAAGEKLGDLLERLQRREVSPPLGVLTSSGEAPREPANVFADDNFEKRIRAMIESLIDDRVERLAEDLIAKVDHRVANAVEASITETVEQIATRQLTKISEAVVEEWAGKAPGSTISATRTHNPPIYLLSVAAALAGVLSAAVVFLLLS